VKFQIDWSTIIKALDVDEMLKMTVQEPDLVLEGSHLGRGSSYYDKDVRANRFIFIRLLLNNYLKFANFFLYCYRLAANTSLTLLV